jgi:topoisomerase-4 subunit A
MRAIQSRAIKVGFDPTSGFVGTKVTGDNVFECTNFDKLLLFFKDGTYKVINVPEKLYVHHEGNKVVYVGVADKKSVISVVYKDPKTSFCYAKRFIVDKFILEKSYRYFEEKTELAFLTTQSGVHIELQLVPKLRQKVSKVSYALDDFQIKGVSAKGIRLGNKEVKKINVVKNP